MFKYLRLPGLLFLTIITLGLSGCSKDQPLMTGLSQADANQIIVILQSQDISATSISTPAQTGQAPSFTVNVSSSDYTRALKILVDNKLPKVGSPGLAAVYPLGGGGLIPSSTQEKAQLLMALQGEIENMLLVLPGIVQARVVIVLPETSLIREAGTPPPTSTASVAIVYNPADEQGNPSVSADDIKYLVASAIPDLSPNSVTVIMASNFPMKLIDIKKFKAKSVTSSNAKNQADNSTPGPAMGPALPPTTPPGASITTTPSAAAAVPDSNKHEFLLILFGALAGIGLLLGVFGLARSVVLRSKLAQMEKSISGEPAQQVTAGAATPPPAGAEQT